LLIVRSSPGLEEYIESLSFLYYLENQALIPLIEVQSTLSDDGTGEPVSTTPLCLASLTYLLNATGCLVP